MNGRTHALIGCAIVPPTAVVSGLSLPETTVLTVISAGFALGPDIDHPNSTISRALGRPVHELLHGMSTAARTVLASPMDRIRFQAAEHRGIDPSHRSLTHTLIFSVAMGGLAYLVGHSAMAVAVMAAVCMAVCRKLVPRVSQFAFWGGALAVLALGAYTTLSPRQVALAAAAGWFSHVVADACTTAGVPVLWPLKVKGRRWWRFRPLGSWLKSGESKEMLAAIGVALVMNIPPYVLA